MHRNRNLQTQIERCNKINTQKCIFGFLSTSLKQHVQYWPQCMIYLFLSVVSCLKIHTGFDWLIADLTNLLLITVFSDLRGRTFLHCFRFLCKQLGMSITVASSSPSLVIGRRGVRVLSGCSVHAVLHEWSDALWIFSWRPGRVWHVLSGCGQSLLLLGISPPVSVVVYFSYFFISQLL